MEESVRGFPPYLQVEAKTRISAIVLQLEGQAVQINHPAPPDQQYPQYHQLSGYNQVLEELYSAPTSQDATP